MQAGRPLQQQQGRQPSLVPLPPLQPVLTLAQQLPVKRLLPLQPPLALGLELPLLLVHLVRPPSAPDPQLAARLPLRLLAAGPELAAVAPAQPGRRSSRRQASGAGQQVLGLAGSPRQLAGLSLALQAHCWEALRFLASVPVCCWQELRATRPPLRSLVALGGLWGMVGALELLAGLPSLSSSVQSPSDCAVECVDAHQAGRCPESATTACQLVCMAV